MHRLIHVGIKLECVRTLCMSKALFVSRLIHVENRVCSVQMLDAHCYRMVYTKSLCGVKFVRHAQGARMGFVDDSVVSC